MPIKGETTWKKEEEKSTTKQRYRKKLYKRKNKQRHSTEKSEKTSKHIPLMSVGCRKFSGLFGIFQERSVFLY